MKLLFLMIFTIALSFSVIRQIEAEPFMKIYKPPVSERWFGIYTNNERVGFYRQKIEETPDGYRMEGDGNIRITVMGFSKVAATHETCWVGKNLSLRSIDVEQTINGITTRLNGKVGDGIMRIRSENNGKVIEKQIKFKGEIYPGPSLNLYPLLRDVSAGKSYNVLTFDSEDVRIKEIKISVLGEEKAYDGRPAIRLRNNLYPFVNNDVWIDRQGNIIAESVRDGLVTTRAEDPNVLGIFVANMALAKKDLIYDFSLVRIEHPIKEPQKLRGLTLTISGWNDSLSPLQNGGQLVEKSGKGRITIRTGSAVPPTAAIDTTGSNEAYLKQAAKIEVDAPEIRAKARELATGKNTHEDIVKILTSWTSDWLNDTIDDTGGALASFKSRTGNCQTHARLYTALARAAGVPTRFVSGLVYLEGKGFLYHSWAESFLGGRWVGVDPLYNQIPADPTHLKLFEGSLPEDMLPIISIIGKIKISVQETKY